MSIFTPKNGTPRDEKNDTRTFAYTARGGSILAKMAFDPVEVGDVAEEPAHSARSILAEEVGLGLALSLPLERVVENLPPSHSRTSRTGIFNFGWQNVELHGPR